MAKVHIHYKHIVVLLLIILCSGLLAYIVIHDLYSKKDTSEKIPVNPNNEFRVMRKNSGRGDDIVVQDVLRGPVISRSEPAPRQNIAPAWERAEPVRQRIEPVREIVEPVRQWVEPVRERVIEPIREKIEPVFQPKVDLKPIQMDDRIPQVAQDPIFRENTDTVSNELDLLKVEEDTLESLTRFIQSRQQNRLVRVPHEDYYVAGVVDFQPLAVGDILTKVRWNVDQYVGIIKECEKYMVDILVFPELGIFSILDSMDSILMIAPRIPPAEAEAVPCNVREFDEILTKLSCAAQSTKMYVAATMMEKHCRENTSCAFGDLTVYLTTVVFDRNGKIVAKYRKYNLYIERFLPGLKSLSQPDFVTFTSDFNVTFGMITGFDIFFKEPGVSLIERYNVTDIIFPSSLPTRLPFLAVSSVVAGWSYVMNVNILSSKNSDLLGIAGNNIYYGRREYSQTYVADYGFSAIVIAPVPKHNAPFPRNFADQYVSLMKYSNRAIPISHLREHALTSISMEPLINSNYERVRTFRYVNKEFFCNISITWEPSIDSFGFPGYRMAGFNGLTNYTLSSINNYVEMCGLILCSSLNTYMCLLPPFFDDSSKVTITSMRIVAASRLAVDDVRIPITLSSDYTVLNPSYYEFTNVIKIVENEKYNIAEITLKKPVSHLISFGIYKFPEKVNPTPNYNVVDAFFNGDTIFGGLLFSIYYGQNNVEVNVFVKTSNNSYLAAVVDYNGYYFPYNYQWAKILNLYQYAHIIEQAARYLIDIVVFPECGLFMCGVFPRDVILQHAVKVPAAEDSATPCDDYIKYDDVISKLSCAAKAGQIYVAVNLWEKFYPHSNSTTDDVLLYNTEVVFDRKGTIVARYRKYNLFVERWLNGVNQTENVELVTFTTDFNETFGLMICFDILFKDPGVTLVKEKQVTSMIFSAAFFSSLPFLATSSIEAGWSYAMDVNLLASSLPINASFAGSNIYFGRNQQLSTYIMDYGQSKIIIGAVPKNGATCLDGSLLDTDLPKYSAYGPKEKVFVSEDVMNSTTTRSLFELPPGTTQNNPPDLHKNSFHYGDETFDCSISVVWKNNNVTVKPNYQFLGYSGTSDFTIASLNNYVEMCGLIMCSTNQSEYCELPPEFEDTKKITVLSLNIVAISRKNTTVTVPITLNNELLATNTEKYSFSSFQTGVDGNELSMVEMNLRNPADNLVTFAVLTLPQKSTPLKMSHPPLDWLLPSL
ncbi:uncharacterized protein LOC135834100 [Planococcus citri]|uniref:uncharacterized protein LOC135834100 n=1 Tax=Planococcus citri TaxID=170843 RepID=UPI0031F9EDC9